VPRKRIPEFTLREQKRIKPEMRWWKRVWTAKKGTGMYRREEGDVRGRLVAQSSSKRLAEQL